MRLFTCHSERSEEYVKGKVGKWILHFVLDTYLSVEIDL